MRVRVGGPSLSDDESDMNGRGTRRWMTERGVGLGNGSDESDPADTDTDARAGLSEAESADEAVSAAELPSPHDHPSAPDMEALDWLGADSSSETGFGCSCFAPRRCIELGHDSALGNGVVGSSVVNSVGGGEEEDEPDPLRFIGLPLGPGESRRDGTEVLLGATGVGGDSMNSVTHDPCVNGLSSLSGSGVAGMSHPDMLSEEILCTGEWRGSTAAPLKEKAARGVVVEAIPLAPGGAVGCDC